ncbi:hypothetical protein G5714_019038 [Onychostoma macrolepis]|uniref:Uncharacterized protein n=1 Tax=Onychostoma macrolepis TaxID=369639 RepID=A0A7J6C4S0_9TELE|nr:hypothetical protein G5714_019038 [Onychostoma macrolepis]
MDGHPSRRRGCRLDFSQLRDSLKCTGTKPRVKGHLRRELWGPPEKAALSEGVDAGYPNDRAGEESENPERVTESQDAERCRSRWRLRDEFLPAILPSPQRSNVSAVLRHDDLLSARDVSRFQTNRGGIGSRWKEADRRPSAKAEHVLPSGAESRG